MVETHEASGPDEGPSGQSVERPHIQLHQESLIPPSASAPTDKSNTTASEDMELFLFRRLALNTLSLVRDNLAAYIETYQESEEHSEKVTKAISVVERLNEVRIIRAKKGALDVAHAVVRLPFDGEEPIEQQQAAQLVLRSLFTLDSVNGRKLPSQELTEVNRQASLQADLFATELKGENGEKFCLAADVLAKKREEEISEWLAPTAQEKAALQKAAEEGTQRAEAERRNRIKAGMEQASIGDKLALVPSILRGKLRRSRIDVVLGGVWKQISPEFDRVFQVQEQKTRTQLLAKDIADVCNVIGQVYVRVHKKRSFRSLTEVAPPEEVREVVDYTLRALEGYIFSRHFQGVDMLNCQAQMVSAINQLERNEHLVSYLRLDFVKSTLRSGIERMEFTPQRAEAFIQEHNQAGQAAAALESSLLALAVTRDGEALALPGVQETLLLTSNTQAAEQPPQENGKGEGAADSDQTLLDRIFDITKDPQLFFIPDNGFPRTRELQRAIIAPLEKVDNLDRALFAMPSVLASAVEEAFTKQKGAEWLLNMLHIYQITEENKNAMKIWKRFCKRAGFLTSDQLESYQAIFQKKHPKSAHIYTDDFIQAAMFISVLLVAASKTGEEDKTELIRSIESTLTKVTEQDELGLFYQIVLIGYKTIPIPKNADGFEEPQPAAGDDKGSLFSRFKRDKGSGKEEDATAQVQEEAPAIDPSKPLGDIIRKPDFESFVTRAEDVGYEALERFPSLGRKEQEQLIRLVFAGAEDDAAWKTSFREISKATHPDLKGKDSPGAARIYDSHQKIANFIDGKGDYNGQEALEAFTECIEGAIEWKDALKREERERQEALISAQMQQTEILTKILARLDSIDENLSPLTFIAEDLSSLRKIAEESKKSDDDS